jgi:hypothetical protein
MKRFFQTLFGRPQGGDAVPDALPAPDADGDHPHFFGDLRIHEALRAASIDGAYVIEDAWTVLGELDGRQLLAFDEAMRTSMPSLGATDDRVLIDSARGMESAAQGTAYAFAAACSRNEYIRQQALLDLSQARSRLGLAAGLIRTQDPVAVIRDAAGEVVSAQLWEPSFEDVRGLRDLHGLMRKPGVPGDWDAQFADVLLRADEVAADDA